MDWTITIARFRPFVVGSWFPTPPRIAAIKACVNVEQSTPADRDYCLLDAVSAVLHPPRNNPQRAYHYRRYRADYDVTGLTFPLTLKDVRSFERRNDRLCINIYGVEERSQRADKAPIFFPLSISRNRGDDKLVVNLLLLQKTVDDEDYHFVAIRDLGKLTRRIKSKNRNGATFCCCFCLQHLPLRGVNAERNVEIHRRLCQDHEPVTTQFPAPGSTLSFKNRGLSQPLPISIFADFETRERRNAGPENEAEEPLEEGVAKRFEWISGKRSQNHTETCRKCGPAKPCAEWEASVQIDSHLINFSWAYLIVSDDPSEEFDLRFHQAPNPDEAFLSTLKKDAFLLKQRLSRNLPIVWTPEERLEHAAATRCPVCEREFTGNDAANPVIRVADHDHRTGRYRGAKCQACNLAWKNRKINLYTHNFTRFDSQIVLNACSSNPGGHVKSIDEILSRTAECFMSYTVTFRCDFCLEEERRKAREKEEKEERKRKRGVEDEEEEGGDEAERDEEEGKEKDQKRRKRRRKKKKTDRGFGGGGRAFLDDEAEAEDDEDEDEETEDEEEDEDDEEEEDDGPPALVSTDDDDDDDDDDDEDREARRRRRRQLPPALISSDDDNNDDDEDEGNPNEENAATAAAAVENSNADEPGPSWRFIPATGAAAAAAAGDNAGNAGDAAAAAADARWDPAAAGKGLGGGGKGLPTGGEEVAREAASQGLAQIRIVEQR